MLDKTIIPGIEWRYQRGLERPPPPVWRCYICQIPFDATDQHTTAIVITTRTGCVRKTVHPWCEWEDVLRLNPWCESVWRIF